MRIGLLVLGSALVAALASAVVVSAGGAARQPTPPRPVGFDVSVTFSLIYHVEWREKRGVQGGCSPWRDDAGIADVFAHNMGSDERPRLAPLKGRFWPSLQSIIPDGVPIAPGTLPRDWAELDAVGSAKTS